MLYLRMSFDSENAGDLRERTSKEHREYIASFLQQRDGVTVVQGGPMLADDGGDHILGSFLVVEAASHAEVQAFHDNDPFTRAGLFSRYDVVRWDRHIGNSSEEVYVP